jgi:hypothetical protein
MMHSRSNLVQSFLKNEASALLQRAAQVMPFSLSIPMVAAASVSKDVLYAITRHWWTESKVLQNRVHEFILFLDSKTAAGMPEEELQSAYALLKLRFNQLLDQFDIFADVISQRSEHGTGVWVAGLDVVAADALNLNAKLYTAPPVMCYLDRGHGAAIRKARTRLPGGDPNPVAIIQIPRERMVGSGIAASLIHEVGHQGAALLDLVTTIRVEMNATRPPEDCREGWTLLQLWLSEIIADFWAMAHLGGGATLGLMSVVSLPRFFMFRFQADDPHPFPWIRVKISLAFGERMYPHPQWRMLHNLWERLYPLKNATAHAREAVRQIEQCLPVFVELVMGHRNAQTHHQPLATLFRYPQRQVADLQNRFKDLSGPLNMSPSLAFAVVGQARLDKRINAAAESQVLTRMLSHWAWQRAEDGQKPVRHLN